MREFTANSLFEEVLEEYEVELSTRTYSCLKRAGISTIGEFMKLTEEDMKEIRNLGRKSYDEIEWAKEKLSNVKLLGDDEIQIRKDKKVKEDFQKLDNLIGLEEVKLQVKRLIALAKMHRFMKDKGMEFEKPSLNMEFVGNPGTAKTTVARIVASILYNSGLVKDSTLYEVGRADLVGEYTGHTAAKVKRLFEKAKGAVIFIDEAYSLTDFEKGSYGDEAISTIVQEMENNREDTIVIFAGYPEEMKEFMERNAGLRSRVPYRIEFKDYTLEEMALISESVAKTKGFSIERCAFPKIVEYCKSANTISGNGRFCRNLVENAIISFAARNFGELDIEPSEKMKFSLKAEDFEMPSSLINKECEKKQIGFSA